MADLAEGLHKLIRHMEEVSTELAQLDCAAAAAPFEVRSVAMAFTAKAAFVARDAALLCARLEEAQRRPGRPI